MQQKCPECQGELYLDPGASDQTSGPPDAWEQGYPPEVYCETCGWTSNNPEEYFEDYRY